jgi:hypothetical protein
VNLTVEGKDVNKKSIKYRRKKLKIIHVKEDIYVLGLAQSRC